MTQHHFSRKTRQLKNSVNALNQAILEAEGVTTDLIKSLIYKIRKLISHLQSHIGLNKVRHILGASAVLFGLGSVNAQNFIAPVENPYGLTSTYEIAFPSIVDIDGDGDYDLFVGEYDGILQYFENTGTKKSPQFEAPQENPFNIVQPPYTYFSSPTFADIDNDGDFDMLSGGEYGVQLYYENTGTSTSPSFGAVQQNPFGLVSTDEISIPRFVDLDGDGDQDLVVSEYGSIVYFQNTGTTTDPQFVLPTENPFSTVDPDFNLILIDLADLDGDGDFDLMLGEYYGVLQYYENTGNKTNPSFSTPVINPFGLESTYEIAAPAFVDLDDDGDLDLLVGEYYGKLQYFENTNMASSISTNLVSDIQVNVYPNPSRDVITISTTQKLDKITLLNSLGQVVMQISPLKTRVDISQLQKGTYFIKLEDSDGEVVTKRFIKI